MVSLAKKICASAMENEMVGRAPKPHLSVRTLTLACAALIMACGSSAALAGASPVAMDDYGHCNINSYVEIDILYNDYGVEHYVLDPNTIEIVVPPSHGGVSVDYVWGYTTYTADTDYEGTDVFRYTVDDLYGNTSNAAYVDIDVVDDYYHW